MKQFNIDHIYGLLSLLWGNLTWKRTKKLNEWLDTIDDLRISVFTAIQSVILIHLTDDEPYDEEIFNVNKDVASRITLAKDMTSIKLI